MLLPGVMKGCCCRGLGRDVVGSCEGMLFPGVMKGCCCREL